jgi:spore coat protein U-like protein
MRLRAALAAAPVFALLGAAPAEAQTAGTIRLAGVVSTTCTLAVADAGPSLDIVRGESARAVATVTETCNANDYTVTLSSLNQGRLVAPGAAVSYTASYDGQSAALSAPLAVRRTKHSRQGRAVTLYVTLPPTAQAVAGSYADTVTVAIAAR